MGTLSTGPMGPSHALGVAANQWQIAKPDLNPHEKSILSPVKTHGQDAHSTKIRPHRTHWRRHCNATQKILLAISQGDCYFIRLSVTAPLLWRTRSPFWQGRGVRQVFKQEENLS
jgi:hypothetical protein